MKLISLSDIQISPSRQRREFPQEYLLELQESIQSEGLFNALVLRGIASSYITGDKPIFYLVQGECRLRAISDIYALGGTFSYDGEPVPPGMVPYTTLGELNPLLAAIAEFHENIKRRDLTWQEKAQATAEIYRLRCQIAEETGKPDPSVAEIAREVRDIPSSLPDGALGDFQADTRKEILLAGMLQDEDIRGAASLRDAFKIAKRKETAARNIQLAETVGRTFSSSSHTLLNEDCLSWLKAASPSQFDVILSDPPYGMGADEFGDAGGKTAGAHFYEDSLSGWQDLMAEIPQLLFKVTKPLAHCYLFCDIDRFNDLKLYMLNAGWQVHRTPLIWVDPQKARIPWVDYGPQRKYELILYANKGKKPVTRIYGDVITVPAERVNLGHQAQKPVALFEDLLRRSVAPGDRVLDPFAGTGPLIPAAHALKCTATLIEKDPAAFGIMISRLKAIQATEQIELEMK